MSTFLLLTLFLSSFLGSTSRSFTSRQRREKHHEPNDRNSNSSSDKPAGGRRDLLGFWSRAPAVSASQWIVILTPLPTSRPAGRRRFLQFRIHTPSPGGRRTRRRTSGPPGASSGFHLCGRFGTGGGRGPDRGLGQRGEPGGHGRLGAGQSSAHGLTWEQRWIRVFTCPLWCCLTCEGV